ncbi:MAG: hypothetical protein N2578_02270 [Bdellovibrionaceae bacterium]|nr:hypothetical protein [Pseudobdellovibrionaceae bacterium]
MKAMIVAALMVAGSVAYATGGTTGTHSKPTAAPAAAPAAATETTAAPTGEVAKASAKEACLKENPKLHGAQLEACIKNKEKAVK